MSVMRLKMRRRRGIMVLTKGEVPTIVCGGGRFNQHTIDTCRTRTA